VSTPEGQLNDAAPQWVWFFGPGRAEGDPARRDLLGGKGASLAAMTYAGLPVPPGFTISVPACEHYHNNGGVWPDGLAEQVRMNLDRLQEATGLTYGAGPRPLLVSVRSGAEVSMPGMMDTILNCGLEPAMAATMPDEGQFWQVYAQFARQVGKTVAEIPDEAFDQAARPAGDDPRAEAEACMDLYRTRTGRPFPATAADALTECINAVFESWNNHRARIYRKAHDIHHISGTAVTIQSMIHSDISGIAFTANPANPAAEEVIIESSYGLGEAVVSGDVTPDRFVLDAATLAIKERTIGHKATVMTSLGTAQAAGDEEASLDDEQVDRVARLARQVADQFGHEVDIEWALCGGELALLQSRPIRGLDIAEDVECGRLEQIEQLREQWGDREKVWVLHNLAETLAAPTPLTWDVVRRFMGGRGGFGRMYVDFGYRPSREVDERGFLDLICGRIYVDPDRAAGLFWGSMPFEYDHEEILTNPTVLETAPMKFNADKADGAFFARLPGAVWSMFRSARRLRRARARGAEAFDNEALPPYLEYLDRARSMDLTDLSTSDVIAELGDRMDRVMVHFAAESLKPGFFAGCARAELEQLLIQLAGPAEGADLCRRLTMGLEGDSTVEQNIMLHKVSRGEATLEAFLAAYGHRTAGEMELSEPRWREDSTYIQTLLARYRGGHATDPAKLHDDNVERRRLVEAELPQTLQRVGGSFLAERTGRLITEAQTLLPYREVAKHYLMMGYEQIRTVCVELGRRWNLSRDVFFLHLDEFATFESDSGRLSKLIGQRKVRWQSAQRLDPPTVIRSDELDHLGLPREIDSAAEMDAVALAPGVATGPAAVIFRPDEAARMGDNCVLVCPSTDPGWTALFPSIRGLVVERGGVLSHGAITARDFGVPAVACPDATARIPEGALVRVDGDRGHVAILQEDQA